MTDPELVYRAEQAYLGAILARHGRSGPRAAVVAGDSGLSGLMLTGEFTDPVHQAIFAAITGQSASTRPDGPAGWPGRLRDLLEHIFSPQARAAAAYMAELPGLCPDPANLTAYAAMVAEASQHRAGQARARLAEQAAREDPTLASAGTWLDDHGPAPRSASRHLPAPAHRDAHPGTGPAPSAQTSAAPSPLASAALPPLADVAVAAQAPDAARLARALRADARRATQPGPDRDHEPGRSARDRTPGDPLTRAGGQSAPAKPEDLEDRVLASLMKHPADGRAVIGWLPAEAFSTAVSRDLYDLIRQRLAIGRPVDPLIIAWDASRLPEARSSGEYGGAAFLTKVALRVGSLEPAPRTAEVLGKALWAERILTSALGEDWPAEPERIRLLATLAAEDPCLRREPAPATTVQAATADPGDPALQPEAGPAVQAVPAPVTDGPAVTTVAAPAPPSSPLVQRPQAPCGRLPRNRRRPCLPGRFSQPCPSRCRFGGRRRRLSERPRLADVSGEGRVMARDWEQVTGQSAPGARRERPPRMRRLLRRGPRIRATRNRALSAGAPAQATATAAPALAEWHDLTPGEQTAAWASLRAWVTWLYDRYELAVEDRLPRCWASHPGLVEELAALKGWREEIYSSGQPSGQAARYWHSEMRQVLHAAATQYALGCRTGHRGATALAATDPVLLDAWAAADPMARIPGTDIAAGAARRVGRLATVPVIGTALDNGDAIGLPGRRDTILYQGGWWVPASAGWTEIPRPERPGLPAGPPGPWPRPPAGSSTAEEGEPDPWKA